MLLLAIMLMTSCVSHKKEIIHCFEHEYLRNENR